MKIERLPLTSFDNSEFDTFVFAPATSPTPAVVMIPEIFGVNQPLREIARRFADEGYLVLVPDIFWRLERNIELGYDEESYKRAFALHAAFDYDLGVKDMDVMVKALKARTDCDGRVAVVGFCLGGTMAYLAASRCNIDCAAAYYGTRIQNFLNDASRVECPTLLHFGEIDHTTPPEIMNLILPAVEPNVSIGVHIYSGAGHAFANPGRADTYVHEASELAHARTFEMFRKSMPHGNQN
jgi:carboxymethylenebutenolidase